MEDDAAVALATTLFLRAFRKRRRLYYGTLPEPKTAIPLAEALNVTDLFTFLQTGERFRIRCVHRSCAVLETCWKDMEVNCRKIPWPRTRFFEKLPTALSLYMQFGRSWRNVNGWRRNCVRFSALLEFLEGGDIVVQQLTEEKAHVRRSPSPSVGGIWQLLRSSVSPKLLPPLSTNDSKDFSDFLKGESFKAPIEAIFPGATVMIECPEDLWLGHMPPYTYGVICVRDSKLNFEWCACAWEWHQAVHSILCSKLTKEQNIILRERRSFQRRQRRTRLTQ